MTDKEYFEALCRADGDTVHRRDGIGRVSEKRLHRIIKSYVSCDPSSHETPVGRYIADALWDGEIFEIQTKAFTRLAPKLEYYLKETPYRINVIYPVIRNRRLIRIDPETGEILRNKTSPKHGRSADLLPELFYLRHLLPNERIKIKLMFIDAEEYRYSERVRYRRSGVYDSELFPVSLVDIEEYSSPDDFLRFIPSDRDSFTAAEYSKFIKLTGRRLYAALALLCSLGLLRKEGKTYRRA